MGVLRQDALKGILLISMTVWLNFCIVALAQLAMLIIPGYLILRAAGFSRVLATLLSPGVSMATLFATCLATIPLGLPSNWAVICLPPLALGLIAFVTSRMALRGKRAKAPSYPEISWKQLALYLIIGILVGTYALLTPLMDPGNIIQEIDNGSHLNRLREFVDSGQWYLFSSGLYPCGWHLIGATSANLLNADIALVENALNFVFASIVFPMSVLAFLGMVTNGHRKTIMYGAFIALAFVAYPWGIIKFGPLFPNMAGCALFPALAATFIGAVDAVIAKEGRATALCCMLAVLFSSACLHPSTVFLAIAFLAPYCVSATYNLPLFTEKPIKRIAACLLFVALVATVWFALYKTPALSSLVNNNWPAYNTLAQSIKDLLLFRMTGWSMQPVLGLLVLLGFVVCLTKPGNRWLSCSYFIFAIFFVISTSTEGFAKHLFTGFWYTDQCRISACLAIAAIPIAAIGIANLDDLVHKKATARRGNSKLGTVFTIGIVVLLALTVYAPQRALGAFRPSDYFAFDDLRMQLFADTNGTQAIYATEERSFVREAKDLVGDSLVINSCDDGTLFAYGADGLNTYYRTPSFQLPDLPEQSEFETDESWIIRYKLADYASDPQVQSAVSASGAEYIILLDADGSREQQRKLLGYTEKKWSGIDAVTEDTPGFDLILSKDDMRLYRIADL